jgi:hypothetical protein
MIYFLPQMQQSIAQSNTKEVEYKDREEVYKRIMGNIGFHFVCLCDFL